MNSYQIHRILARNPYTRNYFEGVYACNEIPHLQHFPHFFIVNTDPQPSHGLHWTLIYVQSSDKVEFFDSFGEPPNAYISSFLTRFRHVQMNRQKLQQEHSQTCGVFCILFAVERCRGHNGIENICSRIAQFPPSLFEYYLFLFS